jgi:hypothetical protein
MEDDPKGSQQALEPVLQEEVPFRDHTIPAVKLADGRYAVVLRWVCEVLNLDPSGQVQRIQRTAAIAGELLRVKVQPRPGAEKPRRGGGAQIMPVLTLRGFSPWILGINPNEVEEDPGHPEQAEHIRELIIAYQQEAIDVLYAYFMRKAESRPALTEPRSLIVPAEPLTEPIKPAGDAPDEVQAGYYEDLAVWALWKAAQYSRRWRGEVQTQLDSLQTQLEAGKAVTDLIPEIIARLGPELITTQQQRQVQAFVRQLSQVTGRHPNTIWDEFKTVFNCPRYEAIRADQWPQVVNWFKVQVERARKPRGLS